ncbi:carbohydrate-binding domain-containing protein [Candidatus Enterococcus ferrettii]|uniref:Carbohydrate-binding domain-containing protein n=1 Tax=Candidatus Enterococcus ferrettii TaxID=2815324 RepID=A0ABV0EM69_9ENTE|nr:carbohydrate-binding domain-containing protein [Enterococcus sp. 665A]MBO1338502.1 carbohydrate-binding domain-containing protein [Enterococcus sp. 665A]
MKKRLSIASLLLALALTGGIVYKVTASQTEEASTTTSLTGSSTSNKTNSTVLATSGEYDEEDKSTTYSESTATQITLKDAGSIVNGEGAEVSDNTVTITKGGTYVISGTLTNGQIAINSTDSETVRIVLNNAKITNETTAAISVAQAEKTVVTTAENTSNLVAATAESFAETEEAQAAIYSKDDLTLNGSGTLDVQATAGHGIQSKNDLKITSGTYTIDSGNEGLKGKDSVQILDGDFTINAANDGIQSTNAEESDKGYIVLDGGTYTISSENDGIQAETYLIANNPTIDITTNTSGTSDSTQSYKGLKAGGDLTINGGTYTIDSVDDSVHSNSNVTIAGGTLNLTTEDDGIHADATTTVSAGEVNILNSYEGIEGANVVLSGGNINVVSTDDGINAAGGSTTDEGTDAAEPNSFGPDSFKENSSGDYTITIEGGTIQVDAEGDGLDSNGDITMTGGQMTVFGPVSGGNGALDYDGTFDITGGTLYSFGSSDMAQSTSATSTQPSIQIWLDDELQAGEVVTLKDSQGNVISEAASGKTFANVVISDPAIQTGKTYTVDFSSGTSTTVAVDSAATSVDSSGTAVEANQGMMGGGGPGGSPGGNENGRK